MKTRTLPLFLAALNAVAALAAAPQSTSPTVVSGALEPGVTGASGSFQAALTPDGRFVVFTSAARDLAPGSGHIPSLNVYLRDRLSGATTLLSVATNRVGGGNGNSVGAVISANGRFVAWQSDASNLGLRDTNNASDVFQYDRQSGALALVSRGSSGWTADRRQSFSPLLSADGRRLVFESHATDLVENDTNGAPDVFVYEADTAEVSLVSRNDSGNGSVAGSNGSAAMTPDGRYVAYVNANSNSPPTSHVFVQDLQAGTTIWASSNLAGVVSGSFGAARPAFSADGSALFFYASNNAIVSLVRYELPARKLVTVAESVTAIAPPSSSEDGRSVAYQRNGLVEVWDAQSQTSRVASVTMDGAEAASPVNARPILSADGRNVTFLSSAGGLTLGATNGLAQIYQRDMLAGITSWLSSDVANNALGDFAGVDPAVAGNGDLVAFDSSVPTLVANDLNQASDVFIRNVPQAATELISTRSVELPAATAVASARLHSQSISADGARIAYGTYDLGGAMQDTNGVQDIYVRELATGAIRPVSGSVAGGFTNRMHSLDSALSADGRRIVWTLEFTGFTEYSSILWQDLTTGETRVVSDYAANGAFARNAAPTISSDGRWAAFESTRDVRHFDSNVTDINAFIERSDVILQDVLAGTNAIVSVTRDGRFTGNGASYAPRFSPDGRWLAFFSEASDLTADVATGKRLLLRDLVNHVTLDVSRRPAPGADGLLSLVTGRSVFSHDSRYLAFESILDHVGFYDIAAGTLSNVCASCWAPALNADGRLLAVTRTTPEGNRVSLIDRGTSRVATIGTGVAGALTRDPVLSGDGRYLVFVAERAPGSTQPSPTLYFRDLVRGITLPLPLDAQGGPGNGASYLPQLAADGRTLALVSVASDLVAGDYNDRSDVFVVRIGSPDTDADGLDDDWESSYFGGLSRDGAGDFDQDGQSDWAEFQSGTDPTNLGSVLSVTLVRNVITGISTVLWNSVPNRTYEVQYQDSLGEGWATLQAGVQTTGTTMSVVDSAAPENGRRFYRVLFAP